MMQQTPLWRKNIVLDVQSVIFQTMFDGTRTLAMLNYDVVDINFPDSFFNSLWNTKKGEGDHITNDRIWKTWFGHRRNLRTNTYPIFFHFPVVRKHILTAFDSADAWLPSTDNMLPSFRINGESIDVPTMCCAGSDITFYNANPFSVCPPYHPSKVWIAEDVKRLVEKCKIGGEFTEVINSAFKSVRETFAANGTWGLASHTWDSFWKPKCDPPDFVRVVTRSVTASSRVAWLDNVRQMYLLEHKYLPHRAEPTSP